MRWGDIVVDVAIAAVSVWWIGRFAGWPTQFGPAAPMDRIERQGAMLLTVVVLATVAGLLWLALTY